MGWTGCKYRRSQGGHRSVRGGSVSLPSDSWSVTFPGFWRFQQHLEGKFLPQLALDGCGQRLFEFGHASRHIFLDPVADVLDIEWNVVPVLGDQYARLAQGMSHAHLIKHIGISSRAIG